MSGPRKATINAEIFVADALEKATVEELVGEILWRCKGLTSKDINKIIEALEASK